MFKKVKELLEAGTILQEVANLLDSEISTELKTLRDESAGWRVKYQDVNKSLGTISKTKDELEVKITSFDEEIKKAREDGKSERVAELEAQKEETQTLQSNLEAIQSENRTLRIDSGLTTAIAKYDVIDADLVGFYVKSLIELKDDSLKFKDGDNRLTLDDGLKKLFDSKPNLLKPVGRNGSGARNTNSGGKSFKDMTLTEKGEIFKNDPREYERLKKQG